MSFFRYFFSCFDIVLLYVFRSFVRYFFMYVLRSLFVWFVRYFVFVDSYFVISLCISFVM